MKFDRYKGYCCRFTEDIVKKLHHLEGYSEVIPIKYSAARRLFLLMSCPPVVHQGGQIETNNFLIGLPIKYCTSCGARFPRELSNEWLKILRKELRLDPCNADDIKKIPEEFKTDEWWRKRSL